MPDCQLTLACQQPWTSGAEFSDDGVYRYRLWRRWDESLPAVLWIMLNPSTADASQDDPTIRRCIDYAQRWGYGSLTVGNLFALRSTDPRAIPKAHDPIGPQNDQWLREMHDEATLTVIAWGAGFSDHMERSDRVLAMLAGMTHRSLYCLGRTQNGSPRHPLYMPKSAVPMLYKRTLPEV